jgi:hypothetical protein
VQHTDRITLSGDGVLAQDPASLVLARDLRGLLVKVIWVLDANPVLVETADVRAPKSD